MRLEDLPLEDSPYRLDDHGPVFILGCPRSGTTFLSNCIGAIRDVEEFVGILAPPRLMHEVARSEADRAERLLEIVRDIFWQAFWRRVLLRSERALALLRRTGSWRDLVLTPSLAERVFCYKEPFMCFAASRFASAFPNSKFIHIVRDGRDNADSLERTYPHALSTEVLQSVELSSNKISEIGHWDRVEDFNFPWWLPVSARAAFRSATPYARYIWLWREMTSRACALQSLVGDNRYLEIQYESFVTSPREHGDRIRMFLGQPDSKHFQRRLRRAFQGSIRISKQHQCSQNLRDAEEIAGALLARLNYL